jgi:tRNA(fMet)-specific endonuclease VapC
MARFHLDSNAVIALVRGGQSPMREYVRSARRQGSRLSVSTIVVYELLYGIERSIRPESNAKALYRALNEHLTVAPFLDLHALQAAKIRAALERAGTPIGPYDLLIAGHALALGATLVTANTREFRRVKGLAIADWSR